MIKSTSNEVSTHTSTKQPHCLLSADVETHSIWFNELRDETGQCVLSEGMPLLLDLYARHDVRTTFFFTGYIARRFPDVVRMAHARGHEVGCHGLSHEVHHGFDVLGPNEQREHLRTAKDILEGIIGEEVLSFRAPALRVNADTPRALADTGFKIDSSVAPQRFDAFMSFGGKGKLQWLGAPRGVYMTDPDNLTRRGAGPLVEVPISALILPYVGTTLRMFPSVVRALRRLLHLEAVSTGHPLVFLTHPTEFIEEQTTEAPRHIARRSQSALAYMVRDVLRAHLKTRHLGAEALPLYEKEIAFFKRHGYQFDSIKNYCRAKGYAL